jgi:hypothetical protein
MKTKEIEVIGGPLNGTKIQYVTRWAEYLDEAGQSMIVSRGRKMATQAAMGLKCQPGYVLIRHEDHKIYMHTSALRTYLAAPL